MDGISQSISTAGIRRSPRQRRMSPDFDGAPRAARCQRLPDKAFWAGALLVFGLVALVAFEAAAAEKFQQLTGAQIQARFAGMEMTDEVHWDDVYERTGTLRTYSMGDKSLGKWKVQKDQLCLDRGKEPGSGCYDVWMSGKKVELRTQGSNLPLEGVLQRPTDRR
jgi:hypothetical protein